MILEKFKINNPKGIHARVAKEIARISGESGAAIKIIYQDEAADAVSILEVLSLGIPFGVSFSVQIEGKDGVELLAALRTLFEKNEDP